MGKGIGTDGVTSELIKAGEEEQLPQQIYKICVDGTSF